MMRHPSKYFIVLSLILFWTCRPNTEDCTDASDPDCPNYNPCLQFHEVKADFEIAQRASTWGDEADLYIPTKVVIANNFKGVLFTAEEEDATYHWYIGSEEIYERQFIRTFGEDLVGSTIPITLIVQKEPNLTCFPWDDGVDTLTQEVEVVSFCDIDILSTFRGALDNNPLDSFDVAMRMHEDPPNDPCSDPRLFNFDQSGDSCGCSLFGITNNYIHFYSEESACSGARGKAFLDDNLSNIRIEYSVGTTLPSSDWPKLIFRGYKIGE